MRMKSTILRIIAVLLVFASLMAPSAAKPQPVQAASGPLVYVVVAIDTEADNDHPMGTLHTVHDIHNYRRTICQGFNTRYASDGGSWTTITDGTTFNFNVTAVGLADPATSFSCGDNTSYGLDDSAWAVRFSVPGSGLYNVGVQLGVVGAPPDTSISVVPDLNGSPDLSASHRLSNYTAHAASIVNGQYVVIGSNLSLQAGAYYWWVANQQSSGNASNRFTLYMASSQETHTFADIMDSTFRNATKDSAGNSFKMSWFMEMDNFFNTGLYEDGRTMNYLSLYTELMNNWGNEVRAYGDEIAYHHHFMVWDGQLWQMEGQEHAADGQYEEHNNALDRMILDARFFPTDFRPGWFNNDDQLQQWVERWLLADYGGAGWATQWAPFHPSMDYFYMPGDMSHWLANCPDFPNQGNINSAFDQAVQENRPVIYCWYMHQLDDMQGLVASTHNMLVNASAAKGVPFRYATAKDAMQSYIGTTDRTSPILTITHASGTSYTITSNEALRGTNPYIAARYGEGSGAVYIHTTATKTGTNRWTVSIPATNGQLALAQVGAGALDVAGNSAVAVYPNGNAPVAAGDSYSTDKNTALVVNALQGVLANDTDQDGDTLTAVKVSGPSQGSLTLNSDGSFTYTPFTGYTGSDSFTYQANDGFADSNVAAVQLQVNDTGSQAPSHIYGQVLFSANPPAAGTLIQVFVPGVSAPVAVTSIQQSGQALSYTVDIPGDDPDTPAKDGGVEGDTLEFRLHGLVVARSVWHTGSTKQLDIHAVSLTLQSGWNLLSIALQPLDSNIAQVLGRIAGQYDLVYAWDAAQQNWLKYDNVPASEDTLSKLDEKSGFWIHITASSPVVFEVAGEPPATTAIQLASGWNLVGYPAVAQGVIPETFSTAYSYLASDPADPWKKWDRAIPGWANDLTYLAPGYGYWVQPTGAGTWQVPYSLP